ncbi:MAG: Hsp20/alpha crystallin family protein [Candidatus Peregrinibacteria bacterium]
MTKTIPVQTTTEPLVLLPHPEHRVSVEDEGQLPVDILENDSEILLITPIAGVDLEQTEVVITNDVLTIRGKRKSKIEEFGFQPKHYCTEECFWGIFSRSVILPAHVDADRIEATQQDHILYIRIPKRRSIKMRIVKISR